MSIESVSTRHPRAIGVLALALLAWPVSARAQVLVIEPGVSAPLTAPQSELFELGGSQSVKGLFGLNRYLSLGPSATYLNLPSQTAGAEAGVIWGFGAAMRLQRPRDAQGFGGVAPWVDADLLYIRTGPLNRAGLGAAVGLAIPIGAARAFSLGPFVRYLHTLQSERTGFDDRDAKILTAGLSLEVGPGRPALPTEAKVVIREVIRVVNTETVREVPACADRDKDGVPDVVDRCPDVIGTQDGYGCPDYKKVIVRQDKLELREKIQFAWNEAKLEDESLPLLDEVALALRNNSGVRVQIEGHTSSEGTEGHNQSLSERRAAAVLDYLEAHGVARGRMVSKGFSSSVPIDSNNSAGGRESNRRVEFVVHFILLKAGDAQ